MRIETSAGPAEVDLRPGVGPGAVVLTHGSAGSVDAPDLVALRDVAVTLGATVASVTQPFRLAGRRNPGDADRQDRAWLEVVAALDLTGPVVFAGRSNGARVACRTAGAGAAAGVVCLAFPVHPPGRPDRDRLAELGAPRCRVLVVQGERDPFGMPPTRRGRRVAVVAGSDHALRRGEDVVTREARRFLRPILGHRP